MMKIPKSARLLLLGVACAFSAAAQDAAPPPTLPTIREIRPGIYEVGKLHLDQKAQTVSFPCRLKLTEGMLEYLLVTEQGATHESLLVADIEPNDLHFAMLLLGAKGAGLATPAPADAPPGQIDAQYLKTAPKLKGDSLLITIRWKAGAVEKTGPVEDWILDTATKKPMARGPWIYNGSMFNDGHFLAQVEGAFAALVTNPGALINNPRKGNDNDQEWTVNEKAVPPAETSVEITIKLMSAPDSPAPRP